MRKKLEKISYTKENVKKIPEVAGVYIFWDHRNNPIYLGKSTNLKKRVLTYLSNDLSPKTRQMINKAKKISIVKVTSEIEALLLEARLVKAFQPRYNTNLKDDKSPLYIRITNDEYPLVLTARKIDLAGGKNRKNTTKVFFGPFPSSENVKQVLKLIRKIFPFAQHKVGKRGCLYSQIGLCNPCPSEIEKIADSRLKTKLRLKYLQNIKNIQNFLLGKKEKLLKDLETQMNKFSRQEKFEEAKELRDQIKLIQYITQPRIAVGEFLKEPNLAEDIRKREIDDLKKILIKVLSALDPSEAKKIGSLSRIEAYDVAHLAGTHPTASMVCFINAEAEKRLYRHFKIKQKKSRDDISSLKEVAQRRLAHLSDWGKPDLALVDGGKGQVAIFWGEFKKYGIPVVGLSKKFEKFVVPYNFRGKLSFKEILVPKGPSLNLLQRLRDESHRFARRLHYKLILKHLIPQKT